MKQLPKEVYGTWRHSYEEDDEDITVFRPASYSFAPSRGRDRLEIKPDGTFKRSVPARGDGLDTISGEWKLKENNQIKFTYNSEGSSPHKIEITECSDDILKVRKV
jgi:hypothetical protein